jgi:hypothetical protein
MGMVICEWLWKKKLMLLSYGHGEECYERHGQIEERTPQ